MEVESHLEPVTGQCRESIVTFKLREGLCNWGGQIDGVMQAIVIFVKEKAGGVCRSK